MKLKKILYIVFLVIGICTLLEFCLIRGMFTGPLMMALIALSGVINLIFAVKDKEYLQAVHFILTSAACIIAYLAFL